MRTAVSFIFICCCWIGSALSADSDPVRADDPSARRIIVQLDPDVPVVIGTITSQAKYQPTYQLAANIPEQNEPDSSLMGDDRIPSDGELDAPPVFEDPDSSPVEIEDETYELPPSAEDAYLPEVRPKKKKKAKRKYKKKKGRAAKSRKYRSKRKSVKAAKSATSRRLKRSVKRPKARNLRQRLSRRSLSAHRNFAALGAPTARPRQRSRSTSAKNYRVASSYRSRRLKEYKAYKSHIMPFGY